MPTQTKENYLKAIYYLIKSEEPATVTSLGEIMQVSKPTVNNMIKKLTAKGWVEYEKYKPLNLTEKGLLKASQIVRKHRLTEMFLVEKMNFGWEEVHDIAEEMEHLTLERFFDRMDELLDYPNIDPHGSPIPNKEGNYKESKYLALSDYAVGQLVKLKAIDNSSESLLTFLNEKEISLGTQFEIIKIESFDKSMTVNYKGYTKVVLSYEVCRRLLVELK